MNRIIIIPIFLLGLFLLIVYGLLPKYNQFNRVNESISLKEKQFIQGQKDLTVLEQAAELLAGKQENWAKIESALPEEFSLASFLYYLEGQATVNGLIIDSIDKADFNSQRSKSRAGSDANTESEGIKGTILSIGLTGAVSSLESFLRNIEKSSRLIWVESIATSEADDGLLRFSLNLKVFSY